MKSTLATGTNSDSQHIATFTVPGEPASKVRRHPSIDRSLEGQQLITEAFRKVADEPLSDENAAFRVHAEFHHSSLQRRDVDNMLKLVLDGLTGVAYPDDTQVIEVAAKKIYSRDDEPYTKVSVFRIGEMRRLYGVCEYCGDRYRTYKSWIDGPAKRKFCGVDCFTKSQDDLKRRTCHQCDAEFMAEKTTSGARYCSRKCSQESQRVDDNCSICGALTSVQRWRKGKSNYCSDECMVIGRSRLRRSRRVGPCQTCDRGVTRKEYKQCGVCRASGQKAAGAPRSAA